MAKFNFQGDVLERGRQVITGVSEQVIVDIQESENAAASGVLNIVNSISDSDSKDLKLYLTLPAARQGERGETGKTPTFEIGTVEELTSGRQPAVEIDEELTTEDNVVLNFKLPAGPVGVGETGATGATGRTPSVTVKEQINILGENGQVLDNVFGKVEDINSDAVDVELEFTLPRGPRGAKGDTGSPFAIQHTPESKTAMLAANENGDYIAGEFIIIRADVENEENSKLYQKTYDGSDSGSIDEDLTGTGIVYINDFSGARGSSAHITSVTASQLLSNENPTVTYSETYDSTTDSYNTTMALGIPKGRAAIVNSDVTVNTLASKTENDGAYIDTPATATIVNDTTTVDSDTVNRANLTLNIPRATAARILDVNVSTLNSNQDATATVDSIAYNSTIDSYDSILSLGIPKGASSTVNSNVIVNTLDPYTNGEATEGSASASTTYDSTNDVNTTQFTFNIPRGQIPQLGIGTVTTTVSGGNATASITYPEPEAGEEQQYDNALLNLTLPRGEKGADGNAFSFAEYESNPNGYTVVTDLQIVDPENAASVVTLFREGVPAQEVSGVLGIAHGGSGLSVSPSLLVDLESNTAEDIFAANPTPGVTGSLPIANGGTGAATAAAARTNLGLNEAIQDAVDEAILIQSTEPSSENTKIWIQI